MSLLDTIRAAAGGGKVRARAEDPEHEETAETEEEEVETEEEEETAETEEEEAETEEEETEEEDEKPAAKAKRQERARIKAILGAPEAAANADLAAHLAFETDMAAKDAKRALAAGGHKRGVVADRMRSVGSPQLGTGAAGNKEAGSSLVDFAKKQQAQRAAKRKRA